MALFIVLPFRFDWVSVRRNREQKGVRGSVSASNLSFQPLFKCTCNWNVQLRISIASKHNENPLTFILNERSSLDIGPCFVRHLHDELVGGTVFRIHDEVEDVQVDRGAQIVDVRHENQLLSWEVKGSYVIQNDSNTKGKQQPGRPRCYCCCYCYYCYCYFDIVIITVVVIFFSFFL